eukprot:CAMPEP_0119320198 /NCGR_PEP_ID=MMETSP1333-20130426/51826_1 /TAXON_ID=418940 /ORGANISM="Scyphosphaera apsteinii, Strain RCC1455" /LENGTH=304 /DNA_ID=CAMNT_0007326863 /DNA_START=18 /DNA_END=929 /DNA_ORIENTATION=-
MSCTFVVAANERTADTFSQHHVKDVPTPPSVVRQSTLSHLLHVQQVLGDNNLVASILEQLPPSGVRWIDGRFTALVAGATRDRVMFSSVCKQYSELRPPQPRSWPTNEDRVSLLFAVKMAEQSERYDEMLLLMHRLIEICGTPLTLEERNLYSMAYRNEHGSRRASLRILQNLLQNECTKQPNRVHLIERYRRRVLDEFSAICNRQLTVLRDVLLPNAITAEDKIWYLRTAADVHRAICGPCGFVEGDEKVEHERCAEEALDDLREVACTQFHPTHALRLGQDVSFSVWLYEVGKTEKAVAIAR